MKYKDIRTYLDTIDNIKTKDIDNYSKYLIKNNINVLDLKDYVLKDSRTHRIYFQVNLAHKSLKEQLDFINENEDLLQDWWHVDQLNQFLKNVDNELILKYAKKNIKSKKVFTRRWGYVMLLTGIQKDKNKTQEILDLLKDDSEYYVYMAEAWLICDLAVFNFEKVIKFLETTDLNYNIVSRAIQKICDSFRISDKDKERAKNVRRRYK